ncbi:MAG: hypothetical protein R3335_14890, partial [Anaerolineales bacterium]|nr:hypothetical protein [Anaerolineales bacterium]
ALRLINEILQQNSDLLTYRYVDKLGPGIQVMLVPNDNPFLLPLPDLTDNLSIGDELLLTPSPTPTSTVPGAATPAASPTPTPTTTP